MNPVATYRVQLNKEFDFDKLRQTLPYLSELGISHIYASPITRSQTGSRHGYDVIDPTQINKELGGLVAFDALHKEASSLGLQWIQDIVPNHIAYSTKSRIVSDIMLNGPNSKFHSFLDVEWNNPSSKLNNRILAPFLRGDMEESIRNGEIRLDFKDGFRIKYHDLCFPVRISSYKGILSKTNLPFPQGADNFEDFQEKTENLFKSDKKAEKELEQVTHLYNKDPELMEELLSEQVYALSNWRTAFKEINYRRFFDQLYLICLRQEEKSVFKTTHSLMGLLLKEGKINGLRVDHIDGLYNPGKYLERLKKLAPKAYIIVEKIFLAGERLDELWPVQGTTGYDFLNQLNGLFVREEKEAEMDSAYCNFTGNQASFDDLLYKCKKRVIRELFSGDVENLSRLLLQTFAKKGYKKPIKEANARKTIEELLVAFPIYRTYFNERDKPKSQMEYFRRSIKVAKQRRPTLQLELSAVEELLEESRSSKEMLKFLMRFQQFSGPVMAKGMEDTAFYLYNRLLSLNEVGGEPSKFGLSQNEFHSFIQLRQGSWPNSINASCTHDTKRGEDSRSRINVLSEAPNEVSKQFTHWSKLNQKTKTRVQNKIAPNKNEEYYIYQTLLGSYPFDSAEISEFSLRLKAHVVKSLREAKKSSNWLSPNQQYEDAAAAFSAALLDSTYSSAFLQEFLPFQRKVAFYGVLNSLSQTLLKIACPGVPDFYQGTELWDLNMVDPDNRREVDFQKRKILLEKSKKLKSSQVCTLLGNFENGQIKLFEIFKALNARNKNRLLFQNGSYIPLTVKGVFKNQIIAFCRKKGTQSAVVVAPRFLVSVTRDSKFPLGEAWKDTFVYVSQKRAKNWIEIFSEKIITSRKDGTAYGFRVAELLTSFPVALLLTEDSNL